jgi:colanic acid/amylovoran biosynthesis glycosyltransferase
VSPTPHSSATGERIALVCPYEQSLTETFIRAHRDHLPAVVTVTGWRAAVSGTPVLGIAARVPHKLRRMLFRADLAAEMSHAYRRVFAQHRITAVLAEYGPTGTFVLDACRARGVRLTVHFHGYDVFQASTLEQYRDAYGRLFASDANLVAVSQPMRAALIAMRAAPERVFVNPCGVDSEEFDVTNPGANGPVLVAVGRFAEKKGPQLTLAAFARAVAQVPAARLRMIGAGPLFGACVDLARGLGIETAVDFLGPQPPEVVRRELRAARAFVQHSVVAPDGDSEGSPVAVAEAAACGLPVISTRHAGIPELVVDGTTGLLVEERDVDAMAEAMVSLLTDPGRAAQLGAAARQHIVDRFDMRLRIDSLRRIVLFQTRSHDGRSCEASR